MAFPPLEKELVNIFLISDSAGETALKTAQACMAQFPGANFCLYRRTFVNDNQTLLEALKEAKDVGALVMHTLADRKRLELCQIFCQESGLRAFDLINPVINEIAQRSGLEPSGEPGALHHLNENYFKRIKAMEFAVQYDDGKDPKGFLKADVVLLGVSRTSKTPLSLFLANKNLKVANLPLVPQAQLPKEIFQVDPNKIVGLTNNPEILNNIRKERLRAYGLDLDSAYSDLDKIKEELAYAEALYQKLGCIVINVASLSIEETASLILEALDLPDQSYGMKIANK